MTGAGLREALLGRAFVYRLFDRAIGAARARARLVDELIEPRPGDRLLDIGCGPGTLVPFLPGFVRYLGLEPSAEYVAASRARYGARGEFRVGGIEALRPEDGPFERAVAFGVLHHLDDAEARALLAGARAALAPGGWLVTIDGCFAPEQPPLARHLLRQDRGRHVRDRAGYVALLAEAFGAEQVRAELRHDLLRIPYTHLTSVCTRPG